MTKAIHYPPVAEGNTQPPSQLDPNVFEETHPSVPADGLTVPRLVLVTEWSKYHSYPPIGQLRALIFNADKNGFHRCIRRIGRRVMIDTQAYFSWVDAQNGFGSAVAVGTAKVSMEGVSYDR